MVNICHEFVSSRNLKFGTNVDPKKSKTKCLLLSKKKISVRKVAPITLGGDTLPWVNDVKHLGHILHTDNSMKLDIASKSIPIVGVYNL